MTKEVLTAKEGKSVYQAIAAVQGELAKVGIAKDRRSGEEAGSRAPKFSFRGIDDVYNALAPLLAANSLCILPRVLKRESVEKHSTKTYNGDTKTSVLFYVTVEVEFDFVSADDGSKHTVKTFGEAMDSGDKATNKAMSAAYKYACLQTFCIPTEGDNDADATMHELAPKSAFESAVVRQMFLDNTSIAFDKAETKDALNELITLNKAKLGEARASGDPEDAKVADTLQERYRAKLVTFAKPKDEPAAPITVEQAVKSAMDKVLGDDQIQF